MNPSNKVGIFMILALFSAAWMLYMAFMQECKVMMFAAVLTVLFFAVGLIIAIPYVPDDKRD